MQRINRFSTGISPNSTAKTGNISPIQVGKYQDGQLSHIKVLEHLGGGKLIIALKGQRLVANTNLMLENGQEMDVMVRNAGDQIVLRIIDHAGHENNPGFDIEVKTPLAEILNRILGSLEEATPFALPATDEQLKQLLQKMKGFIKDIPVDASDSDLADQIRDAIEKIGFGYERKIADAIAKGQLQLEDIQFQLKPELLKLQSYLSEARFENNGIQKELMALIRNALENIESQQMSSLPNSNDVQNFYFQIPVIMQDGVINAELEFYRRKASNSSGNNTFSLILNLSLQLLGDITFAINIDGTNIDCQVKVDNSETLALIEEHSEKLRNNLAALGYEIGRIQCMKETPGSHREKFSALSLYRIMEKIDIVV